MAGYVCAIGSALNPLDVIKECAKKGIYSTFINSLASGPFEGTLADYTSMNPDDNIYFFHQRKIYGIGKITNVGIDCKYCNFPESSKLEEYAYTKIKENLLVDYGENSPKHRWLCTFKADPYFFKDGIDMDEVLKYKPNTFKMLRAFWKLSFIKIGDEENESLKELFLLRHQEQPGESNVFQESSETHNAISNCADLQSHIINPYDLIKTLNTNGVIEHEKALEAAVIYDLCHDRIDLLSHWDYVSHQVIASPFKPVDYMDKIDVFGIRYLPNTKIPCKFLVAELKKENADCETIDQVLKYVDWVCCDYAYGNYNAIEACIIASTYDEVVSDYYNDYVRRFFTVGSHPAKNMEWNGLKLLRYKYENGRIIYTDCTPLSPSN